MEDYPVTTGHEVSYSWDNTSDMMTTAGSPDGVPVAAEGVPLGVNAPSAVVKFSFSAVYIIMMVLTAFGNGMVLVAFIKCHSVRTIPNLLLVSMSVADMMAPPAVIIAEVIDYFPKSTLRGLCVMVSLFYAVSFSSSFWGLLLVTFERYVAVNHPYRYQQIFWDRSVRVMLSCSWAFVIGMNSFSMVNNIWQPGMRCFPLRLANPDRILPIFLILTVVPFAAVNAMYCRLAFVAFKHHRQIHIQMATVAQSQSGGQAGQPTIGQIMGQYTRGTKTLGIILGLMYLSWLPTIANPFYVAAGLFRIDIQIMRDTGTMLLYAGPCLNPLVYHVRNPQFRSAFMKLLGKKVIPDTANSHQP